MFGLTIGNFLILICMIGLGFLGTYLYYTVTAKVDRQDYNLRETMNIVQDLVGVVSDPPPSSMPTSHIVSESVSNHTVLSESPPEFTEIISNPTEKICVSDGYPTSDEDSDSESDEDSDEEDESEDEHSVHSAVDGVFDLDATNTVVTASEPEIKLEVDDVLEPKLEAVSESDPEDHDSESDSESESEQDSDDESTTILSEQPLELNSDEKTSLIDNSVASSMDDILQTIEQDGGDEEDDFEISTFEALSATNEVAYKKWPIPRLKSLLADRNIELDDSVKYKKPDIIQLLEKYDMDHQR